MQNRSSISLFLFFVLVATVNASDEKLAFVQVNDLELASARLEAKGEFETVAVAFRRFDTGRDASLSAFELPAIRQSGELLTNVERILNNSTDWVLGNASLANVEYPPHSLSSVVIVPPLMELGSLTKSIFIVAWTAIGLFGCIGAVWYRRRG